MALYDLLFFNERPLSLRDACRDAGGRAKQDARAERVRERGSIIKQLYIFDPLSPALP
jgi:hypothetical protein